MSVRISSCFRGSGLSGTTISSSLRISISSWNRSQVEMSTDSSSTAGTYLIIVALALTSRCGCITLFFRPFPCFFLRLHGWTFDTRNRHNAAYFLYSLQFFFVHDSVISGSCLLVLFISENEFIFDFFFDLFLHLFIMFGFLSRDSTKRSNRTANIEQRERTV